MPRNGKIARLPREIRDELNRRLEDGEQGGTLARWLNHLPLVQDLVTREFSGVAISKQNLSEWRTGGFVEWQGRQEMLEQSRELAADAREIATATDGTLADHLATVLAARYAAALSGWNGEVDENFRSKLRVLRGLCQDVVALRRSDHSSARVKMGQERLACTKEKTDAELVELFEEWLQKPEVQKLISETILSPEERERRFRVIFGLEPEPKKSPAVAAVERENKFRAIFGMAQLPLPPSPAEAQENTAGKSHTEQPEPDHNEAGTAGSRPQSRPPAQSESNQVKVSQTKSNHFSDSG